MFSSVPSRWVVTEDDLATSADVFPALAGASFPVKMPEFATTRREAQNGRRIANARWSSPRWNFTLSYEVIRDRVATPDLQRIWAFFMSAFGMYGGWWYHDPYDDTVTSAPLGVGDGTTRDFQAARTMGAGYGYAFNEPVYGFWKTPLVYVNGVPTTAFTVQSYGAIRFDSAPAAGATLTWSGKFLFPCEFADDTMSMEQMLKSLFSSSGVKFRSLKP